MKDPTNDAIPLEKFELNEYLEFESRPMTYTPDSDGELRPRAFANEADKAEYDAELKKILE